MLTIILLAISPLIFLVEPSAQMLQGNLQSNGLFGENRSMQDIQPISFSIYSNQAGQRLDQLIVSLLPDRSRSEVQRWITNSQDQEYPAVLLNGRIVRSGVRVREGDLLEIRVPAPVPSGIVPQDIPITVLYEDEQMLVIDKPRGMVVHPAPGNRDGTLVNAVMAHTEDLSVLGGELRPGIVHRLDKDTGGLLMVAKSDLAHRALQIQIQTKTAERRYMAIVWGDPGFEHALVDAPIGRNPSDYKKMAVITNDKLKAREAQTELFVRSRFQSTFALLEAKLHTGRTHQIRVHAAYINLPVLDDPLYGGMRPVPPHAYSTAVRAKLEAAILGLNGQALHAYSLSFIHPLTGERMHFTSQLPVEMTRIIEMLQAA